jgi:hypothetical protein
MQPKTKTTNTITNAITSTSLLHKNLLADQARQFTVISRAKSQKSKKVTPSPISAKQTAIKKTSTSKSTRYENNGTEKEKQENDIVIKNNNTNNNLSWWKSLSSSTSSASLTSLTFLSFPKNTTFSTIFETEKTSTINIEKPFFLQLLIKKKEKSSPALVNFILEKIFPSCAENFVGQENVYEQFLEWISNISTSTSSNIYGNMSTNINNKNFLYITGPSGCGKTMFLELFFQKYNPKKYKFVSIYDYKSITDMFAYIRSHHERKLFKLKTRPEYRIQTTDIQFPYIYIIEDIDVALSIKENRVNDMEKSFKELIDEYLFLFLKPSSSSSLPCFTNFNPNVIFTANYFKGIQSLHVLKKMATCQHISFSPIFRFPIQKQLEPFLEINGGDVRNAKLQLQLQSQSSSSNSSKSNKSSNDHINIFTRIENLTSMFHWKKTFPQTTLEDAIEDDPHLVFQYFLHVYTINPAVVQSYLFLQGNAAYQVNNGGNKGTDKSQDQYIILRKMVHDFGRSVVEKKFKKVEYDTESIQFPFLVKEQLQERHTSFNRRQGWNQYHAFKGASYFSMLPSNKVQKKHEMFTDNFMNAHLFLK